jgi:TolB-like protein/tetratricopeptide (TPR) repeat protein
MAEERTQRRLAAILAADVVDYSRLMEADETGTLATLKSRRKEVLEPLIARHQGRIFKVTGDGVLVDFASAVNAVQCAVELQEKFGAANADISEARHIVLRIGINLGDVMVEGTDLYGGGVNVAVRLEAIAEPGGIIVSGTAYDHLKNKLKVGFDDLGAQTLKNIAEPVRAYRVAATPAVAASAPKPFSDKPSIAVLPFANLSGDPAQEYFSDGITEDMIAGLARLHWLFVIARNSSFTFKGKAVDAKEVGTRLGVRYLLEGSVRRAGERVRIACQLIDAATGLHLWTDRFDGTLSDVFDLQDRITASVIGAIEPKLRGAEIERARRKPTDNIDAYDLFLRALALHNTLTFEDSQEALRLLGRAIELDPNYAAAYGLAAYCHMRQRTRGWVASSTTEGIRLARIAAWKGQDDPEALWMAGISLAILTGESEDGLALIERSLALNPNSAGAWMASGMTRAYAGDSATAILHFERSIQLNPLDPLVYLTWYGIAFAHFAAGRYEGSSAWLDRSLRSLPSYLPALRLKIAICALQGQMDESRKCVERLLAAVPDTRLQNLRLHYEPMIKSATCRDTLLDGLRKAGLPE